MGYLDNTGLATLWSRIKQLVQDKTETKADISSLATVATSGSYSDLSNKPTSLPNPNKLTFTGASTGSYDGSSALTVNIPSGGGGTAEWGNIGGTLSNQTDLQTALDAKADINEPHLLWSGTYFMGATHVATLSESVGDQPHGIVLHWQQYSNGAVANTNHNYIYVPKTHVAYFNGAGLTCFLPVTWSTSDGSMTKACVKYVYVYDVKVTGHAMNAKTYTNNYVLTQVIGV